MSLLLLAVQGNGCGYGWAELDALLVMKYSNREPMFE